ncbi:uncharacterized protein B0H18DRAFT_116170 [Fomitopsis serialis]|uniref:uncharacterized protein n=1 Tax=Fomitopsis serialis TaxID=139415 RepID=UPI00200806CB|nr:uncharacterized protein B0H18DRAFT_116170 [Neoantrodia serialis]KAH9930831.1 hypothetical protein B0H18DRAFT_116170 [Neoantrodia serialis]
MAPKGGNAKKESGRAKKAENEAQKQQAAEAERERKVAEKWSDGSKSNKKNEDKEAKRQAELVRKAEKARLLAEEEASVATKKVAPKAGAKKAGSKAAKPAGPGAIAAGGVLADAPEKEKEKEVSAEPESFAATGLDNALDLLEVVTAKMDKASVGQRAAGLEQHPERRFKAAFEAYKERELPNARSDHPGLRLQQYHDLLYKQFQKSPENPFNQVTVSYDASKDEKVEALKKKTTAVENRLKSP